MKFYVILVRMFLLQATLYKFGLWIVYMLLFGNTVNKRRLGCNQTDDSQQEETSRGIV